MDSSATVAWHKYSVVNPQTLPKYKLTRSELRFLSYALFNPKTKVSLPLYSAEEIAYQLRECFPDILESVSSKSIQKHILRGKSYAERDYLRDSSKEQKDSIRLFSKGLLRAYKIPTATSYQFLYGYPRERYRLLPENFVCPFPPHDYFSRLCFQQITEGSLKQGLMKAGDQLLKLRHWDDSGDYIVDGCYRMSVNEKQTYFWVEVHTGGEGFNEEVFIKRILTAENGLKKRGTYLIIVPFTVDVDKAKDSIRKYNKKKTVLEGKKPKVALKLTEIIHYRQIPVWKESIGLYQHKTRV